jgi:hypothetical protein
VGRIAGTNAFVGVVVRGESVTAYVCDGRKLARWFQGSVKDGRAVLRSASGGRLELELGRDARGVLRLPGRRALSFVAVAARGRAGLFRADRAASARSGRPARVLTGWVRLNDGSLRGASVTSLYRILRPAPGVTVVLLAETGGTIGAPAGEPKPGERVTGTVVPICQWFVAVTGDGRKRPLRTPGCGVPRAGLKPPGATGPSVLSRPGDFRLTEAALAAFADRVDDHVAGQTATLFKLAGQPEPGPSESARAIIATQAAAMLRDSKLLAAAERLRQAGTPAEVLARTEAYKGLAGPHRDRVKDQLPGFSPLVAIVSSNAVQPSGLPVRRTYRGPWAEVSNIETEGDDWAFDDDAYAICPEIVGCTPPLNLVPNPTVATVVRANVRAGFDSSITWTRAHLLTFDVPAGDVEVEIDVAADDVSEIQEDCFGVADSFGFTYFALYAVDADGVVDPFTDTPVPVTGRLIQINPPPVLGPNPGVDCLLPPLPPLPALNVIGEDVVTLGFTAPPEGGTYVLAAIAEATARVFLGGTAVTQVRLAVNKVTVSHG